MCLAHVHRSREGAVAIQGLPGQLLSLEHKLHGEGVQISAFSEDMA